MLKLRPLTLGCLAAFTFTLAGACGFQTGGIGFGPGNGGGGGATGPASTTGPGSTTGSTGGTTSTGGAPTTTASTSTTTTTSTTASTTASTTSSTTTTTTTTTASSSSGIADGLGCSGPSVCQSGFCFGGLCCDTACTGNCMACDQTDTNAANGMCAKVVAGNDPFSNCTGTKGTCDGNGKCSCTNGVKDLGETDVDCGGPMCPKCAIGKTCGADPDCTGTGVHCQQGVCCSSMCTGPCNSCDLGPDWLGTCIKVHIGDQGACMPGKTCDSNQSNPCVTSGTANGGACTMGNQCASNKCTGSVCVPSNQNLGFPCTDDSQCDSGPGGCQANHTCK